MFKLDIPKIMGADINIYNATINAFRCNGNFDNFLTHYAEHLDSFFNKIKILIEKEEFLLNIKYKAMSIGEVREIFKEVYKVRVGELEFAFKEPKFDEMDGFEKSLYKFMYEYGEKIACYESLAGLTLTEIAKIKNAFENFNKQEKDLLNKTLKKS